MSASKLVAINTNEAPDPVGPYNQAVLIEGWLYCSGQIGLNPKTGSMQGEGQIEEETKQVLKNLLAIIKAAGGDPSNVVKTTIYLTDLNDFELINKLYSKVFSSSPSPARACVEVSNLPKGAKIEIDCVAWLGN